MYTENGDLVKRLASEEFCLPGTDRNTGEIVNNCGFKGVVSDGENYVFATNTNGGAFVEVFSIDTGIHVASLPTCGFPWKIDYHPLRKEVWSHCWSPDAIDGDEGHIDVFSATSLSLDINQTLLEKSLDVGGHGTVVVDSSMPNSAYANTLDSNILSEIDANTKKVIARYEIPKVSGLYRMEYSHQNRHLFMRAYICCSCGFEGSDLGLSCGRGRERFVDVVTGPNQAMNVTGKCGHSCEGTAADTAGVYEWDTVGKNLVAQHVDDRGIAGDPYVDPSGNYFIILGNDGGDKATIIKTGKNGEPSKKIQVLDTGFSQVDEEKGISDICFVENEQYNIAVFASTLANFVMVADMSGISSGAAITTKQIWLTGEDETEITANHGRGAMRNCAWAFGSNYIWIDAQKDEMVHIIQLSSDGDISKAKLARNVMGVPSRMMHWVYNHKTDALAKSVAKMIEGAVSAQQTNEINPLKGKLSSISATLTNSGETTKNLYTTTDKLSAQIQDILDRQAAVEVKVVSASATANKAAASAAAADVASSNTVKTLKSASLENGQNKSTAPTENTDPSTLAVVGVVLGAVAIAIGVVNLIVMRYNKNEVENVGISEGV